MNSQGEEISRAPPRRMLPKRHSSFLARTATDDAAQLNRRLSIVQPSPSPQRENDDPLARPSETDPLLRSRSQDKRSVPSLLSSLFSKPRELLTGQQHDGSALRRDDAEVDASRNRQKSSFVDIKAPGTMLKKASSSRPANGSSKLGTFAGVFVPTTLNVLSILMFLRFGFILGQSGVLGMMGMLIASYAINLVTTLSISAIATNGTVRGGGAYYLISRSLGPEFGGSIGIVFYLGMIFNTGMNAVGLIDCFLENFGSLHGNWSNWLPEEYWFRYLWATCVLLICTAICLAGSGLFARASNGLLVILVVATLSIPLSTLFVSPFSSGKLGITYTGPNIDTFRQNLFPHFTRGADGSELKHRENFQDLFGILFPATGGIFAGASMSGDLKYPSKAIPKGTLWGLLVTFIFYTLVILSLAAVLERQSFYNNANVIQDVNISGVIVLLGEFATAFFSSLMGVIGAAKLLQALARDHLVPFASVWGLGKKATDEPIYAILLSYVISQLTMLADINQIASFVTMTYLMTFFVTNLACFLLTISSAPNFRPSFRYFNWLTAAVGAIVSMFTMFFVDGWVASACIGILIVLFLILHYSTPPKPWGDVSQGLIYHQVRKYLLRMRQEHVKFWRPQILLFVNDPRRSYKLIQFCNSLKKGGLFVLGHVIVSQDFAGAVPEAKRQQKAWTQYIDFSKIKSFVNIAISPALEWGTRNVVLGAGLGGMRPNVVVMGFYNLNELRESKPSLDVPSPQHSRPVSRGISDTSSRETGDPKEDGLRARKPDKGNKHVPRPTSRRTLMDERWKGVLPTDTMRSERAVGAQSYLIILEDLLLRLQINVVLAKGFQDLELPAPKPSKTERLLSTLHLKHEGEGGNVKQYIDLWPIQMSAEVPMAANGDANDSKRNNYLTSNFDTYTLILQLGCILHTVPSWKRSYRLRVAVFVEYETDIDEEHARVTTLLRNLRITAEVVVLWLASGDLHTYNYIVNGATEGADESTIDDIKEMLKNEDWWKDLQQLRSQATDSSTLDELAQLEGHRGVTNHTLRVAAEGQSLPSGGLHGLEQMLRKSRSRNSISGLSQLGVSMGMRTSRLSPHVGDSDSEALMSSSEESSSDESLFAASEGDIDDYKLDDQPPPPERRTTSLDTNGLTVSPKTKAVTRHPSGSTAASEGPKLDPLQPHPARTSSDTAVLGSPQQRAVLTASASPSSSAAASPASMKPLARPAVKRQQSMPKFSSKPVPKTKVNTKDEDQGPSIMFTDQASPEQERPKESKPSIYARHSEDGKGDTNQATGFPSRQATPLSFNDLPSRAQHLILNELIKQHSTDTAVVFTTLPSPVEGTCESEQDSIRYLTDLEVLCEGLPPVLLVHSNSMTVTMNL